MRIQLMFSTEWHLLRNASSQKSYVLLITPSGYPTQWHHPYQIKPIMQYSQIQCYHFLWEQLLLWMLKGSEIMTNRLQEIFTLSSVNFKRVFRNKYPSTNKEMVRTQANKWEKEHKQLPIKWRYSDDWQELIILLKRSLNWPHLKTYSILQGISFMLQSLHHYLFSLFSLTCSGIYKYAKYASLWGKS